MTLTCSPAISGSSNMQYQVLSEKIKKSNANVPSTQKKICGTAEKKWCIKPLQRGDQI